MAGGRECEGSRARPGMALGVCAGERRFVDSGFCGGAEVGEPESPVAACGEGGLGPHDLDHVPAGSRPLGSGM